jgi:hypothetical protein
MLCTFLELLLLMNLSSFETGNENFFPRSTAVPPPTEPGCNFRPKKLKRHCVIYVHVVFKK